MQSPATVACRHKSVAQLSSRSLRAARDARRSHRPLSHAVHARAGCASAPRSSPGSSSTSAERGSRQQLVAESRAHRAAAARRQPAARRGRDAADAAAGGVRRAAVRRATRLVAQGDVGERARHRRPAGHAQPRQQLHLRRRLSHAYASRSAHRIHEVPGRHGVLVQERSRRRDDRALQRGQVDQPAARARRRGAVPELPDARRADRIPASGASAGVQRHSDAARFLGLPRFRSAADDAHARPVRRRLVALAADGGLGVRGARAIRSSGRSRARCGWATNPRRCWRWSPHSSAAWRWARCRWARASNAARGPRAGMRRAKPSSACGASRCCSLMAPVSGWLLELIGPQPSALWHWTVAFGGTFAAAAAGDGGDGRDVARDGTRASRSCARQRRRSRCCMQPTRSARCSACSRRRSCWCRNSGLRSPPALCVATQLCLRRGSRCKLFAPGAGRGTQRSRRTTRDRCFLCWRPPGLLGIGYEVLVVRVLSQVAENTVYTFAILLAVYLVGTALGAAAYSRWAKTREPDARCATGCCNGWRRRASLGIVCLAFAEPVQELRCCMRSGRAWRPHWLPRPRSPSRRSCCPPGHGRAVQSSCERRTRQPASASGARSA